MTWFTFSHLTKGSILYMLKGNVSIILTKELGMGAKMLMYAESIKVVMRAKGTV